MADIPLNERSSAPATAVSAAPSAEAPARSGAWPSPVRAWYTLVILTIAFMFSILDRTILSLMIEPIKKDLVISDFEVSLLLGPAFVMIYAFSSLPISRIADWASRKVIIAAGLAFWSFATACCGLAQSYWPLFIARTGVGAGESSFAPATYSILADLFPREKLAIATGFLSIGYSYGAAVALILGGAVIGLVRNMPNTVVPGLGVIHPWQWTFIIVGVPGILLALFFQATVRSPHAKASFVRRMRTAAKLSRFRLVRCSNSSPPIGSAMRRFFHPSPFALSRSASQPGSPASSCALIIGRFPRSALRKA